MYTDKWDNKILWQLLHGIYIRYKHIFSAIIGTYSNEQTKKIPRIFIRDRNKKKDYTYVLLSNIETLEYYEKSNDDLTKAFLTLLGCHIHYIQNCGKPFLVPDGVRSFWFKRIFMEVRDNIFILLHPSVMKKSRRQ